MAVTASTVVTVALTCMFCVALVASAPSGRHRAAADGSKVSIVLNSLAGEPAMIGSELNTAVKSRSKRHATGSDAFDSSADLNGDTGLTRRQVRERRNAVLLLHTSLRFCNHYPGFCRRVEIDEEDVRIRVRLEEE